MSFDLVDCEVCLQPSVDPMVVTFNSVEAGTVDVRFCTACVTAVFQLMAERYNRAVDENNKMVDKMCRWLGIPPLSESDP